MRILHECEIPDAGKAEVFDKGALPCKHCGRIMQGGDAFTATASGYFNRLEFRVCTPNEAVKE